jgi:hypothetical protein
MISFDVALHCLGGFVVTACYGLPRPTGDLDVLLILPSDSQALLVALAGRNSDLHKKHGVYLDVVTVATYPENYEQRLSSGQVPDASSAPARNRLRISKRARGATQRTAPP